MLYYMAIFYAIADLLLFTALMCLTHPLSLFIWCFVGSRRGRKNGAALCSEGEEAEEEGRGL